MSTRLLEVAGEDRACSFKIRLPTQQLLNKPLVPVQETKLCVRVRLKIKKMTFSLIQYVFIESQIKQISLVKQLVGDDSNFKSWLGVTHRGLYTREFPYMGTSRVCYWPFSPEHDIKVGMSLTRSKIAVAVGLSISSNSIQPLILKRT